MQVVLKRSIDSAEIVHLPSLEGGHLPPNTNPEFFGVGIISEDIVVLLQSFNYFLLSILGFYSSHPTTIIKMT